MGIPRFYRWLSERYPRVNQKLSADVISSGNCAGNDFGRLYGEGSEISKSLGRIQNASSSSFPCDCLYLDLNGIIHNSTHANSSGGRLKVKEDVREVWLSIMNYIDNLVQIAKPKRLLFLGVDGVAPRAKMNQQRARRFRAAQERTRNSADDILYTKRLVEINQDGSVFNPPPKSLCDLIEFDSNCITPGTEFMDDLIGHLIHLVQRQLATNPSWKDLEVILSGPDVPGEGEHKIMEFIRAMRSRDDWPADLSHCVQGLDADLVMLALMTHEPRFTLLREEVVLDREPKWVTDNRQIIGGVPSFQVVHICILREYLALDILSGLTTDYQVSSDRMSQTKSLIRDDSGFLKKFKFEFNAERVIDDFLLICCLAGNDFLPHLKFADISNDGIDILMSLYQTHLMNFKKVPKPCSTPYILESRGEINRDQFLTFMELCAEFEESKITLDKKIKTNKDRDEALNKHRAEYYDIKMGFTPQSDPPALENLVKSYFDGLHWIMRYYYDGVPSWGWFYPYHYPPFARDIVNVLKKDQIYKPVFHLGRPFSPFQQLMGVLPPFSANLLPKCYRHLMTSPNSRVRKFYPTEFEIDREDSKVSWGGVALLPFIDAHQLTAAMALVSRELSPDVKKRDVGGFVTIYVNENSTNPSREVLNQIQKEFSTMAKVKVIENLFSTGAIPQLAIWNCNLKVHEMASSFSFQMMQGGRPHSSQIRPGFTNEDFQPTMLIYRSDSPCLTIQRLHQTRISKISRRANVVRSFYRTARRQCLCMSLLPEPASSESVSPEPPKSCTLQSLFESTQKYLQSNPISDLSGFSEMYTVRASWPLRILSKVIGVWSVETGYIALHPKSHEVLCPLLTNDELYGTFQDQAQASSKRNENLSAEAADELNKMLRNPRWKSECSDNPQVYHAAAEAKYIDVCRSGLDFDVEKFDLTDDEQKALLSLYNHLVSRISGRTIGSKCNLDQFNWLSVMFEIVDHEEIRENLGCKPLMRFKTSQSRLCFWPQIEWDEQPMLTTEELQERAPPLSTVLHEGDPVMCSSDGPAFGSMGWVAQSHQNLVTSYFPYCEDPQSRADLQSHLDALVSEPLNLLRLNDLAKMFRAPLHVIKWMLRHINVRVKGSYGMIDIGLNILREAKHIVTGANQQLGVPGYSFISDSGYTVSDKVVDALKSMINFLPNIVSVLTKAHNDHARSIVAETLLPRLTEDMIVWCLKTYTNWLHIQPFHRSGSSMPGSQSLSSETMTQINTALTHHLHSQAVLCPLEQYVTRAHSIIRDLVSPVAPMRAQRYLRVGQRVVTIKSGGPIAPGSFGVIVGQYPSGVCEIILEKDSLGR